MSRLPVPGADAGSWGDILNDFLTVELNADGTLKKAGDIVDAQNDATQALADAATANTNANSRASKAANLSDLTDTAAARTNLGLSAAGGVLSGTYPNPSFASDMATQAELDTHASDTTAVHGITDTSALETTAGAQAKVDTHAAAADPHAVYQKESEKGAANGYAGLDSSTLVPRALLGTGTLDGTKFLRDDGTWQNVTPSLTPWTSDIDGGDFVLSNVAGIGIGMTAPLGTGRLLRLDAVESVTDGLSRTTATISGNISVGTSPISALTSFSPSLQVITDQAITTATAVSALASVAGSATSTNVYGVFSQVQAGLGNTFTTARAFNATMAANLATIALGIGLDVHSSTSSGTFTEVVGVRVTDLAAGTTKWGMQIGNYNSYHEGALRVGALSAGSTAAPNSRLDVVEPSLGSDIARFTTSAAGAGANPIERIVQQRALTLNATQATLISVTIPASTTVAIHAYVAARRDNSSSAGTIEDGAFYEIVGTFKNAAGTATQIGSTTVLATHESQAGWDCVFDVSSATARIRITGAANNSIYWQGTCHIFQSGSS